MVPQGNDWRRPGVSAEKEIRYGRHNSTGYYIFRWRARRKKNNKCHKEGERHVMRDSEIRNGYPERSRSEPRGLFCPYLEKHCANWAVSVS